MMIGNIIWEDLKFFLTRLRALRTSEMLALGDDEGFCVSTCCDFESWVYYPANIEAKTEDEALVNEVIRFFRERNTSFLWPVYDEGKKILENAGLLYAGDLTAMTFDSKFADTLHMNHDVTFELITSADGANRFASNVWLGFDGSADTMPENYCKLMEGLSEDQENLCMYIAKYCGEDAGTFLVTNEPELMGVYYFSTLPRFRRMGIARAMMNEICRLSLGKRIVLQSTPSGVFFYRNYGFDELFKIAVCSIEADVF